MKSSFLLAVGATVLLASCSDIKKTENGTAGTPTDSTAVTTTTTTTSVAPDTIAYRDDARHVADRVAQDLALTDPTVKRRLENVYYTRANRIAAANARYTADTTGRYLALRQANDEADEQVRATLNNPAYYNTYSTNRAQYGEGPYSLPTHLEPIRTGASGARRVAQGSAIKKLEREGDGDKKTKYENGAKIKRSDDGDVKIKRADGTKIKIDEDGHRTVKKSIFH